MWVCWRRRAMFSSSARRCCLRRGAQIDAFHVRAGRRRAAPPALRPAFWRRSSCGRCASADRRRAGHGRFLPHHDFAVEHRAVGQASPIAASSGKRSVTSSSPRDHSQIWPARLTSCARMPSYFHSTSQSAAAPARAKFDGVQRCARKNGYGWPPTLADVRRLTRRDQLRVAVGGRMHAPVGVAHQPLRDAAWRPARRLRPAHA